MSRLVLGAVFLTAGIISDAAAGQVSLGAARTPRVTVNRPEPAREQPAQLSSRRFGSFDRDAQQRRHGRDLFVAHPDSYEPGGNDRGPGRSRRFPEGFGFFPTAFASTFVERVIVPQPIIVEVERTAREPQLERDSPPPPASAPIVVYAPPAKSKTLYIIPRCYAGDKRPLPDQLPAGCDLASLRVIPPSGT